MMDVYEWALKHHIAYTENHLVFRKVFKQPLKSFWDKLTGFDIVKFDEEFLKTPDGVSTKDYALKLFGNRAVELLEILIRS